MRLPTLLFAATTAATAACASSPRPGEPAYPFNVAGAYAGRFFVDGEPFDATMQLRTGSGGRVSGGFRVSAPVEIDGAVRGSVVDDLLRITVTYPDPAGCDARIEGILTIESGGGVFSGPVTVHDCRDALPGRMSFRRRTRRRGPDPGDGRRTPPCP